MFNLQFEKDGEQMERHCGVCHEKTHKELCWRCEQQGDRLHRAIQKKLQAKRLKKQDVQQIKGGVLMPKYEFNVESKQQISDGYHTFEELYYHRMMLFSVICNQNKEEAWKSWKHDDGSMFDDYFIVGIHTPRGHYTYHYHKDYWDLFDVTELKFAPKWDGHKPEDITRLLSLI